MAPMPLHDFHRLLRNQKCTWVQQKASTHFVIYDSGGKRVSGFAVKKGNSVLPCYVKEFKDAMGIK